RPRGIERKTRVRLGLNHPCVAGSKSGPKKGCNRRSNVSSRNTRAAAPRPTPTPTRAEMKRYPPISRSARTPATGTRRRLRSGFVTTQRVGIDAGEPESTASIYQNRHVRFRTHVGRPFDLRLWSNRILFILIGVAGLAALLRWAEGAPATV